MAMETKQLHALSKVYNEQIAEGKGKDLFKQNEIKGTTKGKKPGDIKLPDIGGKKIQAEGVYDTVKTVMDKGSNFVKNNPVGKVLGKVVAPTKSTDGGANRKSVTAASQKAKGLRTEARGPQFAVIPRSPKKQKEYDDRFNKWLGGMKPSKPVPVGKKKKVKESVEGMASLQKAQKAHLGIKSNPFGLADITAANNAILKKQGLGHQMTADGQNINFGATARKQFDKVTAATQDPAHASKLKAMGTSAAQMKKTGDDLAWKAEREINQYTPGTVAHQNVGIEKDLAAFGSQFKPKKNSGFKLGVNSYEPKGDMIEDYHKGQGEKIQKRTKKWMEKKGQEGAPGLDAMKARTAEHEAKRGVKEEVVDEATRLKKEQGYQKGGTKKPSGKKDAALSYVLDKIKKEGGVVIGQGSRQQKKVKGVKSDAGTGKYKRAADEKKQTASDAKEMGYGDNVKGYIETKARYGSKENMKSGRGLGT